jgi:hypothetical protein
MRPIAASLLALAAAGLFLPAGASAQTIGTFRWQLVPYCNVLTVTVVQNGGVYALDGFDDQCGASVRAPLVGLATPNPDGTIGLGFSIVTAPAGQPVHVAASITLATVAGSWRDSAGASGTFAFLTGAPLGGSVRPPAPTVVYGSTLVQPTGAGDRGLTVRASADPGPVLGDAAAIFGQWGTASGWGSPGSAGVRGDSATGAGVLGTTASGTGVAGVAATGLGVTAYAESGTALRARTNTGTTAIEIDNGAIKVSGSVRPAFQHVAAGGAGGNISGNVTRLDHPLLNGDPNALVFVEHVYQEPTSGVYLPDGVGVYYAAGQWSIYREDVTQNMPSGAKFNVLVVKQ